MSESLGKVLKRIRESKNLSIEDVSERSRIPKHIVSAVEEDRLREIGSVFYAKSFVKTYAAFLGAIAESSVKEYLAHGSQQNLQKKQDQALKPLSRPISQSHPLKSVDSKKILRANLQNAIKYKNQITAVLIGVFILWILPSALGHTAKFFKNIAIKSHNKIAAIKKDAPVAKKTEKAKPKETIKEIGKEAAAKKDEAVKLELLAMDNTWLQIIVDGDLMFTGSFRKGTSDTWKAKKEIKMEVGNSGAIKINVNGKSADFAGKKGEKKEIVITKDGIK